MSNMFNRVLYYCGLYEDKPTKITKNVSELRELVDKKKTENLNLFEETSNLIMFARLTLPNWKNNPDVLEASRLLKKDNKELLDLREQLKLAEIKENDSI